MSGAGSTNPRIPAIDALRGCALVGMFAFHLTWDLGYFGLIPARVPFSWPVMNFGHLVAITFLALVGASLVLASRHGMNWRAYGRRLAMIVAAAAAITIVTLSLFPDSFIFFGILHTIAVASLLALPFLRAPPWVALAAAALMALAPLAIASPSLDNILGWSLGLSAHEPRSNDWRPLLPWGGATIAGVGLMRWALARGLPAWLADWREKGVAGRVLVWGGRHSLLVYLVHQPVFLGLVYLVALMAGPAQAPPSPFPGDETRAFQESCERTCLAASANALGCASLCSCVGERARDAGLWRPMMDGRMTEAQSHTIDLMTRQCAPGK